MHYPDLSPYVYREIAGPGTPRLNVCWLDPCAPFPTGPVPNSFLDALWDVWTAEPRWAMTRGFHVCRYCPEPGSDDDPRLSQAVVYRGVARGSGSCEIYVPSDEAVYHAPDLLFHYIVAHGYCPPEVFVDATIACAERLRADRQARRSDPEARRRSSQVPMPPTETPGVP